MAVGQMAREVVGTKDRHHTVGLVTDKRLGARHGVFHRTGALVMGADGDGDLALHGGHFGAGLPQRFAGFAGDSQRQRFLVLTQQVGITTHYGQAILKIHIRPVVEGGAGSLDGRIDLSRTGGSALPDHLVFGRIP